MSQIRAIKSGIMNWNGRGRRTGQFTCGRGKDGIGSIRGDFIEEMGVTGSLHDSGGHGLQLGKYGTCIATRYLPRTP